MLLEIPRDVFALLENTLGEPTTIAKAAAEQATQQLLGNPMILGAGVILIIATIAILFFLKKIIINSILGVVVWAIAYFVLGIKMNVIATLIVSIIFGLAGIGAILLLKFFGITI